MAGMFDTIGHALGQITPEQRAMLLRMAAANTRSPVGATGLMKQADDYLHIAENAKRQTLAKQELDQRKEYDKFRMDVYRDELSQKRKDEADALAAQQEYMTDLKRYMSASTPEDRQKIVSASRSVPFLDYVSKQKGDKPDQLMGRLVAAGFTPGTKQYEEAMNRYLFDNPNTTVNVNLPGDEKQSLTGPTLNAVQKDILSAEQSLRELGRIKDTYSDEYLTAMGQFKGMLGAGLDKIGSDIGGLATWNANRGKFASNVRQFFNQYRKEITGAAASEKELQQLVDALFSEDLGPKEFKTRINEFFDKAQMNLNAKRSAAREGLDVSEQNVVDWTNL